MRIYHGSLEIVDKPEIREPNRTLDYGKGFYTTTDFTQAENWVRRHSHDKEKPSLGYVNIYDIDSVRNDNTLWFDAPTEEWIDFVYANRNDLHFSHNYDFVYGPVANDRVYAAFTLYESNLLNKQELIRELKTFKLVDQLLFHTEKSLGKLIFVESKEVIL